MKKYLLLLIPTAIYIVVDLFVKDKKTYTDEERLKNLELAREQKKAKAVLADHEQLNNIENGKENK